MKSFLLSIFLMLIISGCAHDVANRYYLSEHYPEKSITEVEVLHSKPIRKFIVIADFQSRGENAEDMRQKAADVGADAVIVSCLGGYYSTNEEWANEDRHKATYSRIVATAIKYIQEEQL